MPKAKTCSKTLQRFATHYNTLQCTTTPCNTPQHTATHRNTQVPHGVAGVAFGIYAVAENFGKVCFSNACCSVLQCGVLRCVAVCCSVLPGVAACFRVFQCVCSAF